MHNGEDVFQFDMYHYSSPACYLAYSIPVLSVFQYLPSCFAEKNLNGVSGFIKLQLSNGRQWSVRCLYRGGRAKLSQGWFEFTVENNLGEGDVCVFELLRTKEVELQVTVFRVTEDAGLLRTPLAVQQQSQNMSHTKLLNPHLQHRVSSTVKLIRN